MRALCGCKRTHTHTHTHSLSHTHTHIHTITHSPSQYQTVEETDARIVRLQEDFELARQRFESEILSLRQVADDRHYPTQ